MEEIFLERDIFEYLLWPLFMHAQFQVDAEEELLMWSESSFGIALVNFFFKRIGFEIARSDGTCLLKIGEM